MKISVITICRNSQATIGYTIESFLRQRHPNKELVVVDGLSTDDTLKIIDSFSSDAISVVSEADAGIYDAMNKGLRRYSGEAVGFLHSDDTFHDETSLETIAEALGKADIVFGDLEMVRDHVSKDIVRVWRPGDFTRLGFHLGWIPPHPTLYTRRKVFDAVGEFDTKYAIAADYDFMLRALMKHRFSSMYARTTLVDFQVGGTSTKGLSSFITGNLECLDSRRRHFGRFPIDLALFGRPIRRLYQVSLWSKASR